MIFMSKKRFIIGMSGASGAPLALELLRQLQKYREEIELHFVMTKGAELTLRQEAGMEPEQLKPFVDVIYENEEMGAGPASGSFKTMGMIIIPCSMKTVAGIVSGYSDNLLLRAADVTLKERRRLLLVARETPLSTIHLRNLYEASQLGAVILPPMLSYYDHPESIEDCNRHICGKILDFFDLEGEDFQRWEGLS